MKKKEKRKEKKKEKEKRKREKKKEKEKAIVKFTIERNCILKKIKIEFLTIFFLSN